MKRLSSNFSIALDAVFTNRLRALLTALGIMFGVAAVIAMLAIGTGARQELLEQMKLIGSNNIIVESLLDGDEGQEEGEEANDKRPYSPGLSVEDAKAIVNIPTVDKVSPELLLPSTIVRKGRLTKGRCVGVNNAFFELNNLSLERGSFFHNKHLESGSPVCIIGKSTQAKFFGGGNPIGKKIKCGNTWLTVVGLLGKRFASKESLENLGIRDYNTDIYIPIQTALSRFRNRAVLTAAKGGRGIIIRDGEDQKKVAEDIMNYHQLDRLVIRVNETAYLEPTADIVARMLKRRHWKIKDYQVTIPELLLKQQQRTQDIFNIVLGAIAGISLLVGGIGIMNIMLASVLERIKEIGLRRSLGATRKDIVQQFVFEAVFISLIGGIVGVALGLLAAVMIAELAEIQTIVSWWSVALSFGVAAAIGLIFGIVPARRAAQLDPITALRND